jgi:uncharacterized protein YbjT (DUF2867 family)
MTEKTSTTLIVGGTGTVGSALATALTATGQRVRVGSRHPDAAVVPDGAVAVRLDLQDEGTFPGALDGVDQVFVLAPTGHADQFTLLQPFLHAVHKTPRKVVTMTAKGVEFDEHNPMRRVELLVASSGAPFVHLRPGWFMQNFQSYWHPMIMGDGVITLPAGDSKTAFIDARDIADVAAVALSGDSLDGQALGLTGPEALTHDEAAAVLAGVANRPITYKHIDDASFKTILLGAGLPADYADTMIFLYGTVRQGFAADVDDSVARVLGKARTLKDYARDFAAAFRR